MGLLYQPGADVDLTGVPKLDPTWIARWTCTEAIENRGQNFKTCFFFQQFTWSIWHISSLLEFISPLLESSGFLCEIVILLSINLFHGKALFGYLLDSSRSTHCRYYPLVTVNPFELHWAMSPQLS